MNGFVRLFVLTALVMNCFSVARGQDGSSSDSLEKELQDDFAEFDNNSSPTTKSVEQAPAEPAPVEQTPVEQAAEEPANLDIVDEKTTTPTTQTPVEEPTDLDAEFDKPEEEQKVTQPTPTTQPPAPEVQPPPPVVAESAPVSDPGVMKYTIKSIRYRPNDSGGTIVIEGDGRLSYSLRKNQETGQFIVEIPNARLPEKLKRPLVTKDISGPYGSIDAYQNAGSSTARVVVQLRKGASDPILQTEGSSLLVVGTMAIDTKPKGEEVSSGAEGSVSESKPAEAKPLDAKSLEEFLTNNKHFYGERQNFETVDMDLREFFYKYMAEWSGLNIYFDENIKQTLTIKLTDVPWDQALVDILRWKKLGYVRVGDNGLRISTQADLSKELDEMARMIESKKSFAPLVTKKYYLSFVGADEEKGRIAGYVSKRGVVNSNPRVQILVITDTEESHKDIERQIRHDDVAPRQVLIEGKIVEANEKFTRSFGLNWGFSGNGFKAGKQNGSINLGVSPGAGSNTSFFSQLSIGTFDVIGSLQATLSLYESEGFAKVISSPRVVTLNQQQATISQDSNLPYNTGGSVTVGSNATTTANPSVTYAKTQLNLAVTPQITYDGSVLLKVDFSRTFAAGQVSAGTPPQIEGRSANTNVLVKNGQTAVLAGIYQSDAGDGSTKVPFLADLPIVGWLFKNKNISTAKNELMIFITPKVLGDVGADEGDKKIEAPGAPAAAASEDIL